MQPHKRETVMIDMRKKLGDIRTFGAALRDDRSGLALVEFAVSLPFFMGLAIAGVETANYAATTMQVNQIIVHVADNAARMGANSLLSAKRVSEIDINDVFTGARHEGRGLTIDGFHPYLDPGTNQMVSRGNARIFLSSVEPVNNPNPSNKFRIRWQRCSGPGTHYEPLYGKPGTHSNVNGIGPTGRQVTAPEYGAVMFAEIHYHFRPMLDIGFSNLVEKEIVATAAMIVRDSRDTTQIYNAEGVTPSTCT
jgi:hypothetical protein